MATWRVPKPPGNHVTPWWLKAIGSITDSPQNNPCILCRRLRLQTDFFGRRQIRRQGELSPSERQRTRGCMPCRTCGRRLRPRRCSAWGRCCVTSSATSSRLCRKQLTFVFISSCKKDAYRGGPLQALLLQILPMQALGPPPPRPLPLPSAVPPPPASEPPVELFALWDFDGQDYGPEYLVFQRGARLLRLPDPLDAAGCGGWAYGQLLDTATAGWFPPTFGRARGTKLFYFEAAMRFGVFSLLPWEERKAAGNNKLCFTS